MDNRQTKYRSTGAMIAGAASILLAAFGSPAMADAIDDRAKELLPWVARHTGYKTDYVKVTVVLVEPKEINLVAYGANYRDQTNVDSVSVGATIFLPNWFVLGTNDDILVHELTHVLQFENDATFKCRAEQEKEAYETQVAFIDETGIGNKPSPIFRFLLRCSTKSVPQLTRGSFAGEVTAFSLGWLS